MLFLFNHNVVYLVYFFSCFSSIWSSISIFLLLFRLFFFGVLFCLMLRFRRFCVTVLTVVLTSSFCQFYRNALVFNVCLKCRNEYKVYKIACNLIDRCGYVCVSFKRMKCVFFLFVKRFYGVSSLSAFR